MNKELKDIAKHPDIGELQTFLLSFSEFDPSGKDYRDVGAHYVVRKELEKEMKEKFKKLRLSIDD